MKLYQSAFKNLVKQMQKTIYLAMDKDSTDVILDRLNNQSDLFFSSRLTQDGNLSKSNTM